ncbi:MAG TPA: diadenylate cyclase [Acidimicrobiales bacterium]|nr:diadenylate cyclase [Acidimicrobiales bacterium]
MTGTGSDHPPRPSVRSGHHDLPRRLERLAEELHEQGLPASAMDHRAMLLEEVDRALRPEVHERYVPSSGVILVPTTEPERWSEATELVVSRNPLSGMPLSHARPFVDGLSSWLVRRNLSGQDEWLLFDRPAGSERDLVVLAQAMGAVIVQRHPSGVVRIVGDFGVLRWDGLRWHHEPPVSRWLDALSSDAWSGGRSGSPEGSSGGRDVLEAILRLAVHDLGSRGIGALLVYRPEDRPVTGMEVQPPPPPPLRVRKPTHLGPLRHALAQVDGAAVFDAAGVLRMLGVRLVPTRQAEGELAPWRGTRHTSALRYSYDDPSATVVVVSESGPISVVRAGAIVSLPEP